MIFQMILPKIMAVITRHPRQKPDFEWSKDSIVHNVFRVWELIFWRRYGIRPELSTGKSRDDKGNEQYYFVCHSWESVFAMAETLVRQYITRVVTKLKRFRLPDFNLFNVFMPEFAIANVHVGIGKKFDNPLDAYKFAIAYDTSAGTSGSGVSSLTYSHTCTGSNLSLVVSGGERINCTGITYNTVALTMGTNANVTSSAQVVQGWLASPATGAHNVVATFSGSSNIVSMSGSFTGTAGTFSGNTTGGNASSGSPSITVTSATNNLVVDACSSFGAVTGVGASQTQMQNITNANGNATTYKAGAASVTMTETTVSTGWGQSGVSLAVSAGVVVKSNFFFFM